MELSKGQRSLLGRIGAYTMHSRHDVRQTSASGRAAFNDSFAAKVREAAAAIGEHLSEAEVARRAEMSRKAHYAGLAYRRWHGHRPQEADATTTASIKLVSSDDGASSDAGELPTDCDWCAADEMRNVIAGSTSRICRKHARQWYGEARAILAQRDSGGTGYDGGDAA